MTRNIKRSSERERKRIPYCPVCKQRLSRFDLRTISICPFCRYPIRGKVLYL